VEVNVMKIEIKKVEEIKATTVHLDNPYGSAA